jgi:hypothetical protein
MVNYVFKLKILLLSIGFMFIKTSLMSQSNLTFEVSQVYSNFKFLDSTGTQDKTYKPIYCNAYNFGYRFESQGGFLFRASVGMRKAGATMVYDAMSYKWDMQYADVKVGVGYIYNKKRFQPYISASPYFAYLLKADQLKNNETFDIVDSKSMKMYDYGFFVTPGLKVKLSDFVSIYTEFNYMMGLQNLETDNGQEAYNNAFSLSLGVILKLGNKVNTNNK